MKITGNRKRTEDRESKGAGERGSEERKAETKQRELFRDRMDNLFTHSQTHTHTRVDTNRLRCEKEISDAVWQTKTPKGQTKYHNTRSKGGSDRQTDSSLTAYVHQKEKEKNKYCQADIQINPARNKCLQQRGELAGRERQIHTEVQGEEGVAVFTRSFSEKYKKTDRNVNEK